VQKLLPSPAPPLALVPPLLLELPLPVPVDVPPPVGFAPPDAEEAGVPPVPAVPLGAVPAAAVPDEPLDADEDEPAGVVELVVLVVVEDAPAETLAELPPGTVKVGTPAVPVVACVPPPPHAARPTDSATPANAAARAAFSGRVRRRVPLLITAIESSYEPSGSIRLPQFGQSLRSFWVSWSHQLQKRRLSTAHGSSEGVGASGSSIATTSSSSPVSRSTYSLSGSASITISRPVDGVRIR
jgi:hypothetical protein